MQKSLRVHSEADPLAAAWIVCLVVAVLSLVCGGI